MHLCAYMSTFSHTPAYMHMWRARRRGARCSSRGVRARRRHLRTRGDRRAEVLPFCGPGSSAPPPQPRAVVRGGGLAAPPRAAHGAIARRVGGGAGRGVRGEICDATKPAQPRRYVENRKHRVSTRDIGREAAAKDAEILPQSGAVPIFRANFSPLHSHSAISGQFRPNIGQSWPNILAPNLGLLHWHGCTLCSQCLYQSWFHAGPRWSNSCPKSSAMIWVTLDHFCRILPYFAKLVLSGEHLATKMGTELVCGSAQVLAGGAIFEFVY